MTRITICVAGLLVLAGSALYVLRLVDARRPKGSDTAQLQRMLFEGEAAAERGDAAGVTRYISNDYQDAIGLSDSAVRYEIAAYIRRQKGLELVIPANSVQILLHEGGNSGTVRFQLQSRARSENGESTSDIPIQLQVVKEPVTYFGVFPGKEWRVISAEGYTMLD